MYSTDQLIQLIEATAVNAGIDPAIAVSQLSWESAKFNPSFVYGPGSSPKAAMGIAQFIASTGAAYGLTSIGDFYNPDKAVPAWAAYMNDLLNQFGGRYDLALAAYDWGPAHAALRQALADQSSILNYSTNSETSKYVRSILTNAGYDPGSVIIRGVNDSLAGGGTSSDGSDGTLYVDDTGAVYLMSPTGAASTVPPPSAVDTQKKTVMMN